MREQTSAFRDRSDPDAFLEVKQAVALLAWDSGCDMRVLDEIAAARDWAQLTAIARGRDPELAAVRRYLEDALEQPLSLAS